MALINYTTSDIGVLATSVIGSFMNGLNNNAGLIITVVIALFAIGGIVLMLGKITGIGKGVK